LAGNTIGGEHAMSIKAVSFAGQSNKNEYNEATMTEAEIEAAKLNIMIEDGGTNLSVGQRQLICIARAFISKPKLLLMDEATANIDEKTDQAVQGLIKTEFSETTVITIAHRLNTIIQYDKILVLNQGKLEEFGSPRDLLEKEFGYFKAMVSENGENFLQQMWELIEAKELTDDKKLQAHENLGF